MKFSFSLLKELIAGIGDKKEEIINTLNTTTCEVERGEGETLEVSVPANRFSDLASHRGIAQEIRAVTKYVYKKPKQEYKEKGKKGKALKITREDKNACARYGALYVEGVRVAPSPKWMKTILQECGIRPINNVVDIMNYVMVETGQPLHAFDYEKIGEKNEKKSLKNIIIRRAKRGERITALDGKEYMVSENMTVIADERAPLAIAGIKGGTRAEVGEHTKNIVVEAAHFEGSGIYEAARALKLTTDASVRFAHGISPALVREGMGRASVLLQELTGGVVKEWYEEGDKKEAPKIFEIEAEEWNSKLGVALDVRKVEKILTALGWTVKIPASRGMQYPATRIRIEAPVIRNDIATHDDIIEEIGRIYGLNAIAPRAPRIHITPSVVNDMIVAKDKIRDILKTFGIDEVYNHSFVGEGDEKELVELHNPIAEDKKYLRASLTPLLIKNIRENVRFKDEIKIFEIGTTFQKMEQGVNERVMLNIALASRNKEKKEIALEAKGMSSAILQKMGIVDYEIKEGGIMHDAIEAHHVMEIIGGGVTIGVMGILQAKEIENHAGAMIELDMEVLVRCAEGEHEYKPLPKYPSIMRDISILVGEEVKIGEVMQTIQESDREYIEDVDLIDEYRESMTFRIVFQADDRTLTDREVNEMMKKVVKELQETFHAQIR